jgi:chitosanase
MKLRRLVIAGTVALALLVAGCGSSDPEPSPKAPAKVSGLARPQEKEIAMELVSSAENSTLDWKGQYAYIEDIHDGRGYTAGIIGFCSGTNDMLELVRAYDHNSPDNPLSPFLPALAAVNGSDSHKGLGAPFVKAWRRAARDPAFQKAQDDERDRVYFDPAVKQARADGLRTLGQFVYYDAMVMHGPGGDPASFGGIRKAAIKVAKPPARGGDERTYLEAFFSARKHVMHQEEAHADTTRVDTGQRVFLDAGNFDLRPPLEWKVYGDRYSIPR